jgi:hypothetical protein
MTFEGEYLDVDTMIQSLRHKWPYVASFGVNVESLTDHFLVIEKTNVIRLQSLPQAIICCFMAYFIYNIQYPPDGKNILLFLEQSIFCLNK